MRRLGCLTPLGLIAGLITVLIVAGVALAGRAAMFSPGALNARTEGGQELGGVKSHAELVGNCTACHVDPWSSAVMATRCLSCHTDVRAQLNDPDSLHGALPDVMVCRTCHPEHNGASAALTRVALKDFPHDRLKFKLTAHQTMSNGQPFACADCHGDNVAEFDQARCETCHRGYQADFVAQHVADFGGDCLACHDGADRFSGFDHNRLTFALSGEHSQIACGQCHAQVRAAADFASAAPNCVDCHRKDDAHNGAFGTDCAKCHTSDGWEGAKFDHNLAAFKLVGQHQTVACEKCHANNVFKGTPQTCAACHQKDDHHQGAFGTDCAQCHNPASWQDAKFDHNLAAFKLEGQHQTVECAKCHANNVFKGTPQTCVACHLKDDHHQGAFGSDCAQCHNPSDWKDAKFDHNLATFKLVGQHQTVECAQCHVNNVFKGTPQNCVACHQKDDHHQGAFGTDCAQCHNPSDWKDAKFDHNLAAFKLTGAHAAVPCAQCHVNGVFKGTPQTCVSCHAEPQQHLGAFGTDCAQCHTTQTWQGAKFDHAFPLDHGGGGSIACQTCHTTPNFKEYTCYGCHDHDPARVQAQHLEEGIADFQDCARCHGRGQREGGD